MAKDNKKTLIIVDREELVFQTLKYFENASALKADYDDLFDKKQNIHVMML